MSSSFPSDRSRSTSTGDVVGDEKRLRALRRYYILDTAPEPAFDRVARLAARLFDAPAALVTFVDRNRQWFKSTVGIDETEMGLHASMCAYTLEKGDVLAIEDLTEDERFGDNPFVTDHGFRFYAGAPLVTPDGRRLGTVCVFDTEPRSGPEGMEECLSDLAAMVVDELELRRERAAHEETRAELTGNREVLEQAQQLAAVGGSTYDPQTEELTWTDETYRIFGLSPDADIDLDSALEFYAPESRVVLRAEVERLLDEGGEFDVELDAATAQGEYRRIRSIGKAWRENGETTKVLGVAQDITQQHRDRRLQEMQSDFFEWIATGAPIDAVIDEIVRFTEEKLPDAAVSILRLDDNRLYHVSGPSLPEDYIAAIDGVEIGPDVGACGAAAYREQEVVTEDIREDERWDDFRAAAEQAGFRSCASQTIQGSDGTVLGTFAVYREEPGPPIPADRELVERMSHVASVALERDRRVRALRASEERWRTLVEEHPGPIHVTVDGTFAYANEALAELFGVETPEAVVGKDVLSFARPDERARMRERVRRLADNREATPLIEHKIVRADGEERTVLVQSVPITYRGQEAAQTMMWDVTERRTAERELRQSEQKFRTIVENAQPITFMVDRDGTFVLSEGQDLQALDLEPGEVVGESIHDVEENNPEVIDAIQRALDGEYVDTVIEANGLIFDCWYSPIYDGDGEVDGVIGMAGDITERREAQKELREQKEMLQTLFDNVPAMIMLIEDGELQMINEHLEEVLGWSEEALDGPTDLLERCYPNPGTRQRVLDVIEEAPDEWTDERPKTKEGDRVDTTWKNVHLPDGRTFGIGMDISERKARERELRDTNRRLRLALEAANAGTFEFDVGTNQVQLDERTIDLFGLESDAPEREASLFEEVILDDGFERLLNRFDQTADEERSRYQMAYRIRRPDTGAVRHIHTHGLTLRDEDGEPERVIGVSQDVTERRRRKEALERQNDLFTKAQDIARVGAWEYDVRSDEMIMTEEAYRIGGLAPDADMTRERGVSFYHPDDQPLIRDAITRAIEKGEPYDLELRLMTDDGTQRWVRTRGEPQRGDGEVVQLRGTIQDITDQKEIEEELRRSREQLSMAVEGGNIGTWNWDLETDTFVFNDQWAEMLGYAREELDFHFRTWEELVHPEDLPRALDALEAYLLGTADTYDPEIRMRTKSGDWRWIQTIGKVVEGDEEGTVTRFAGIHLDIDDRKRAEQALRTAKARYQTLIEHFPDGGVFLFDEDLEYTIAGGKGLEDVGLTPSDFKGNTIRDLFPAELAETAMRYYRRALEGQKNVFDQTLDGRHHRVQTLPVRDGDGEVVAGMAVSQDITERKETRQRLERYRAYTDRLLDAVDDLFFVLGEEAQFRRWNERLPEVTGYSDDELAEMTALDLVPESEHERMAATVGTAFVSGSVQAELPLLRKDGTTFPYEFVGSLVRSPEGELQIVGVGRDITERKRRKEALERKNDLFTKAQDIASVGAWEYHVPSDEMIMTDMAYRIGGLSPDERMTREKGISVFHPEDQPAVREAIARAVEEGTSFGLELRLITEEGEQRWVRTRGEPQEENGEVVRLRGTVQDVTGRVRRREALKEAKETAEEADRIKSALLSNMNHEFRTPLTSIISFSELLSREPELVETFADRILGGGRRLLHTLNTVMDFAELESGSVSLTPMRVDVNSLVRSTVNAFSHLIDQDLSVQIHEPAGPLTASLDEHHVERVLTHLVHNALKFTEEGTIEVTLRDTAEGVAVSVSDPGIGIDPEVLPRMFDEFAQASSGSDRTHEGNGIGLTIVKRLVDQMDGDVTLRSTPGEGTTATVRLPNLE